MMPYQLSPGANTSRNNITSALMNIANPPPGRPRLASLVNPNAINTSPASLQGPQGMPQGPQGPQGMPQGPQGPQGMPQGPQGMPQGPQGMPSMFGSAMTAPSAPSMAAPPSQQTQATGL